VLDEHVHALAAQEGVDVLRPRASSISSCISAPSPRLTVETASGPETITARWIVDATGRGAWMARRLGHFKPMPEHPTRSVWARYRNLRDFDGDWLAARDGSRGAGRSGRCGTACSRGLSTNHFTGPGGGSG